MGSSKRRAVITGCGAVTSIGISAQAFWEGMAARRSGIRQITGFDVSVYPSRIGGEVLDFEAAVYRQERTQKPEGHVALDPFAVAAKLAMDDSSVGWEKLDKTRFGVESARALSPRLAEMNLRACELRRQPAPPT